MKTLWLGFRSTCERLAQQAGDIRPYIISQHEHALGLAGPFKVYRCYDWWRLPDSSRIMDELKRRDSKAQFIDVQ